MQPKRITALDVMRGFGIMVIIIIHRIHYDWVGMADRATLRQHFGGPLMPLIVGTIVLFTMAGIFYLLSGTVNGYSIYARVQAGQLTPSRAMRGGVITGLWLILLNYFQRLFFMNGFLQGPNGAEPEFPTGLISGWLQRQGAVTFRWSQVTEPGTLSLIGLILIIVSLVLWGLLSRYGAGNTKKIYGCLGWLGTISLGISPFVKYLLMPYYSRAYDAGSYVSAWLLGHLCQEFSIFPYLGYGFLGAMVGISLISGELLPQIRKRIHKMSLALLAVGLAGLIIMDRGSALGERIMGASVCYIELAAFLFLMGLAVKFFDQGDEIKSARRTQRFTAVRRFGMVSLTVYIFEPVLAGLFKLIINGAFGTDWSGNLLLVVAFGFFCLAIWWVLLILWGQRHFAGSTEWLSALVMRRIARKESGKTAFEVLDKPSLPVNPGASLNNFGAQ